MIDAWSGPTPTPQQFPANEPNGIRKLLDKIKALEIQVRESTSNLLGTAGIRLTQLGMFIDSSLTVGGSLDVTGPMVVGGTLSLPAGIIDNAALVSPVVPQKIYGTASNFALTTSMVTVKSITITVPAGFTSATVSLISRVIAFNSNTTGGANGAGADYLYTDTKIDAGSGVVMPLLVGGSSGSGINVGAFADVLTGLTGGGTFTVAVDAKSGFAGWNAVSNNIAELSGSIQWYR